MADDEQRLRDIQREYLDFLDDEVRNMSLTFTFSVLSKKLSLYFRKIKVCTWHMLKT